MTGRRQSSCFRRILVGYDGSLQADKAAEVALSLARSLDARVLVFGVARPPEPPTSVELEAMLDDAQEHYEEKFKKIRARALELEIQVDTDITVGHPAEQIIHRAEEDKIDLIVVGRRGVSRFEKWILGSVSERVLRYAHCPVMVIR